MIFKKIPDEIVGSFTYNPDTGQFSPLIGYTKESEGYLIYRHPKFGEFKVHRLAWWYTYGEDPGESLIDHKNCDGFDNRKSNLRKASHEQNLANQRLSKNNTSGVKGVYWDNTRKKWRARGRYQGKYFISAYFESLEEAESAIREAREKVCGEFTNHG